MSYAARRMQALLLALPFGACADGGCFSITGACGGGAPSEPSIQAVRLADSSVVVVSDETRGSGPVIENATGIALDPAGNRLLVIDVHAPATWTLYAVDLASGNRTILSDETRGSGPLPPPGNAAIALDEVDDRVFVAHFRYLITVDPDTGDRLEVSGPNVGQGPDIGNVTGVALDLAEGRAFVADTDLQGVLEIDLATGDRSVLDQFFQTPTSVALDAAHQRLLVTVDGALLGVDLATGLTEAISPSSQSYGPPLSSPRAIALDAVLNRVLVANGQSLVACHVVTGLRTVVATTALTLKAIALDAANNRVLVAGSG